VLLDEKQVNSFRQQVPGWRVTKTAAGTECIRFDWKVKDAASGAQLVSMIEGLFAAEKHQGKLHCVGESEVFVEMYTEAVSGLSENDFICAAKINDLNVKDLLQQKRIRYWA
jgi:4a-hydroxytetrahydrobiopterin dehydratase